MIDIRFGNRARPRLVVFLLGLATALVPHNADARQVLFVTNQGNESVGEYNATTGATISPTFLNGYLIGSGYLEPYQPYYLAVDGANRLYVSDHVAQFVETYNAFTAAPIAWPLVNSQQVVRPHGMALDGSNHLFVADFPTDTVEEFNATTGATINANFLTSPSGIAGPLGLAVDGTNHLFVSNYYGHIGEYDATTGATINANLVTNTQGLGLPNALVVDQHNHLFVANPALGTVSEYDATTGATLNSLLISGLGSPNGLTIDNAGHLFVTNEGTNSVGEYDAASGAVINADFINGQGLNEPYAILFVPVPEPSTLSLAGAVSLVLLFRRRWIGGLIRQRR